MTRRVTHHPRRLACVLAMVGGSHLWGCASQEPAWSVAQAQPVSTAEHPGWTQMRDGETQSQGAQRWSGSVQALAAQRPGVANAGLQLPAVSPDGRWIASLKLADSADAPQADGLITGRGLLNVSLYLRQAEEEGDGRMLAARGACWPTWSPDGRSLAFISREANGTCVLHLHDLETRTTRRLSVGLRNMFSPAVSPDGRWVAVSSFGEVPDQALLFLIDLDKAQATPGPPPVSGGAQLLPHWLDPQTLLYVELGKEGASANLIRWTPGSSKRESVGDLDVPASVFDAIHTQAGVAQAVSPGGRFHVSYSPRRDRLELTELTTGRKLWMRQGDRACVWWGQRWLITADDAQLSLNPIPSSDQPLPEQASPRLHLLPGRWVPRFADTEQSSLLLLGQHEDPARFTLLQLWVVAESERK